MSQSSKLQRRRPRFTWQPNPVMVKELRSRMRGGRAFVLLTSFLSGLGVIGYGLFQLATSRARLGVPLFSAQIGQTLFGGLSFTLLLLVCVIAPAVTVNAISSERERLTYEMLVATPLPTWRLLWGKLIAALSYIALLLIAAVPLGSIVYLFGGITFSLVVQAAVIISATAITTGMIGLWASTLTRRTAQAAVLAYVLIAILLGGLLFSAHVWAARRSEPVPWELLTPNPISALGSVVATLSGPQVTEQVFLKGKDGAVIIGDRQIDGGFGGDPSASATQVSSFYLPGWQTLSIGLYPPADLQQANNGQPEFVEPRSVWRTNLQIQLLGCLALFWMSLHLVRPRQRWRPGWGDLAMLSVVCTALLGIGFWRGWWM